MQRRQAAEVARLVLDRVRAIVAHVVHLVRLGGLTLRRVIGRGTARQARVVAHDRQVAARSRFWTELRTGQREAQARSAGRDR